MLFGSCVSCDPEITSYITIVRDPYRLVGTNALSQVAKHVHLLAVNPVNKLDKKVKYLGNLSIQNS